jgi:cytochrome c-type biogenesis protein CcmH/NrfF
MEAEEILEWESMAGVAAASALQYGRYASDLRSTNGLIQRWSDGTPRQVIETFGGLISFNVENCWYLDTAFCGPLHQLKARMGTNGAAAMIKGIAWGIFALALLVFFMLIVRVIKHQHCCDAEGKQRTFKQKARGSAEEMSNFGVIPTLVLATCLWVPIAMQQTIVAPCWECYDFEAAAVHEIGHVLGLGHPDAIVPQRKAGTSPVEYHPTGSNVYSTYTVSNAGMKPYDSKGFPSDLCMNPWEHVVDGVWDQANDMNPDSGVRQAIMYSLTEHNPKVCLTSDDIEAIYTVYPLCDGRALPSSTGLKKGEAGNEREGLECYKTQLYIGAVRVLIYIFVPILFIMVTQILILACLKRHHDEMVDELHDSRTKAVNVANKHKKKSIEMEAKAVGAQDALARQIETEDERVEERAQEMAAQMIQAKLRGNMVRKASASNFGEDMAKKMAAAGQSKSGSM